jgi:biopolymer transport protein ExbD
MAFGGPGHDGGGDEGGGGMRPLAEINVTPLVDVMLVLLVVFMVAAPMMVVGVPVELPRSAAPRAAAPRPPLVLTVARDGRLFLRQEEVAPGALVAEIRAHLGEDREQPVYVRGDRAAPYGVVLSTMGRLTQAGVQRVSLIAEAEAARGEPGGGEPGGAAVAR